MDKLVSSATDHPVSDGTSTAGELLPCPFCGNDGSGPIEDALQIAHLELDWRDVRDAWTVQCDKCTATMGYYDSEEEAIDAWNTRTPAVMADSPDPVSNADET